MGILAEKVAEHQQLHEAGAVEMPTKTEETDRKTCETYRHQHVETVESETDPSGKWQDVENMMKHGWRKLDDLVSSFATFGLSGRTVSWGNLDPGTQKELNRWTPRAKEYLENGMQSSFVFAARLWHTLDEKLFALSPSKKWPDGPWAQYGEFRDLFKGESEKPAPHPRLIICHFCKPQS